ncbi:MAG TPA: hypothetical protein VFN67_20020 [Polyangiales bacterium]|nr:hypothetical protein [Polyangiales bacterium]
MQVEETTPSTPLRPTRAGFVRGLPLTMPVEEVIERGREVGIELQPSDIHAARYYMRQVAAAGSSSIPQQLLLGGTFVTKREPRAGAVGLAGAAGAAGANGASKATNGSAHVETAGATSAIKVPIDPDDDDSLDKPAPVAVQTRLSGVNATGATGATGRGRKAPVKVQTKAEAKAEAKADAKAKGANGLHSRLQARLRNATFRETAREERETRETPRVEKKQVSAGKALLLDLDNALKQPKSKRAAQASEALEEQLRLIALRVGTQRVREILDHMEELARRA